MSLRSLRVRIAGAALAALCSTPVLLAAQGARAGGALPASGQALITRMHDAYAGKWFRTLTFTQRTTQRGPDGADRVSTWYEASRAPADLRIDIGAPSEGNGVLYRRDSSYRFRAGAVVRASREGNPLIPFVMGLYQQPVDSTLAQLATEKFDMTRVSERGFEGRRTFVVGAADSADLASPQFWVDAERLVLVRMITPFGEGESRRTLDVFMRDYRPIGKAWIAAAVDIRVGGVSVQREEYSDIRADVPLDDALFDPAKWATAKHWLSAAPSSSGTR